MQQVKRRGISPLEIVDEHDQLCSLRKRLAQASDGLKQARSRRRFITGWEGEIRRALAQFGEELAEISQPGGSEQIAWSVLACQSATQRLDERLIWQAATRLKCSPLENICSLRHRPIQELRGQARLANPCFTNERHDLRTGTADRMVEHDQLAMFVPSSDKGRLNIHERRGLFLRHRRAFPAWDAFHAYALCQGLGFWRWPGVELLCQHCLAGFVGL
jgi:hypothetical protein